MKSVLISIQPKWCEMIASGEKTIEVRKNRPKLETPFKCYIYCTLPPKTELFTHGRIREYANELIRLQNGKIVYGYGMQLICDTENRPYSQDNFLCRKVIGEFVCDAIVKDNTFGHDALFNGAACMSETDAEAYSNGLPMYGWHISNLVIYETPKKLSDFKKYNRTCYYDHLGLATPKCKDCKGCRVDRPPQSWCYVETLE